MSQSPVAFTTPCPTPSRSAGGWTRGMPPPRGLRAGGGSRLCPLDALADGAARAVSAGRARMTATSPPPTTRQAADEDTVAVHVVKHDNLCPPDTAAAVAAATASASSSLAQTLKSAERDTAVRSSSDATRGVHGGERVRGGKKAKAVADAIVTPIVQSSTFTFADTRACIEYNQGIYESFEYGRYGNPTTRAAEEKLMALENAEDALFSSSGMNAVTTMLLALVPEAGHIVTTTDCYRRTRQFINAVLPKMRIRTTVIDPADLSELENIFDTEGATLFFSECPTNPLLRVIDAKAITRLCAQHGVISVIDTTFATPANFKAIDHNADLVLHSGTKYLAGHHDVLCGAIAGRKDLVQKVRSLHGVLGGVIDPHASYLILRGMKTLSLRMEAHNRNASAIANFLESHPKVAKVHYPTLESHVDYNVSSQLFTNGVGGVLSFELVGDGSPWSLETFEATGRFVDALRIPYIGPSLGGCESLVEQVCIMGYFDQPLRERMRLGITNGLVRFAAGIENDKDLIKDIEQALSSA